MTDTTSALRSLGRAAALALTVVIAACGDPVGVDSFEEARQRWNERAVTHYSYVLRPLCFCISTGPFRVTVRDDEIVSVVDDGTGEPVTGDPLVLVRTIDQLFVLLDEAWAEDAHVVQAEYDPTYGFPTELWIDYNENVADEELGYQVSEFAVLD